MVNYLSVDKEFNMLSLLDLLEARDLYHIHLMHKANVVATAVGRYLIREEDPWPSRDRSLARLTNEEKHKSKGERRLDNSEVRPYSWPCILVFVDKWVEPDRFGNEEADEAAANDMVPKAIYMPDGRVVPVCVVKASLEDAAPAAAGEFTFPDNLIGGGYPVIADVQEQQHVASIGCMVTDGHLVYALTNRHVTGEAGEPVYSILDGKTVEIGKSSKKQLTRLPFQDVYAGWPGKNVYVNLDIGLIEVADRNQWTAQVFGVGQMGKLADLSINNISLKLIDCPVRAYGCASKETYGQVYALFYRYKSVGGFEYVADFLIGARRDSRSDGTEDRGGDGEMRTTIAEKQPPLPFSTNPGDSGTVWLLETGDAHAGLMPMAVQWGGHVFVDGSGPAKSRASYALATCLSTVCNLLEVDVVRDWNIGHPNYWGEMGHYTVGAKACGLVKNPNLRKLMTENLDRIGFDDGVLRAGKYKHKKDPDPQHPAFVPLADVADIVWRPDLKNPENKPFARREDDNNHFANMDQPGFGDFEGQTLLELCEDPDNVDVNVWLSFYESFKGSGLRINPGALPFRVWQIYNEMVNSVKDGDATRFLCAAGLLAHYVGDACQPLHVSRLHHGDVLPGDSKEVKEAKGDIHSVFETTMLNNYRARGLESEDDDEKGLIDGVTAALSGKKAKADTVGGHAAAVRVIQLMREAVNILPPAKIVETFPLEGDPKDQAAVLWGELKHEAISCIAAGCLRLASFWESAWKEGNGDVNVSADDIGPVPKKALQKLYQDRDFIPSRPLSHMAELLD